MKALFNNLGMVILVLFSVLVFLSFFGGPFRYIDSMGTTKIVDKLNQLTEKYGEKFQPCERLAAMAKLNERFYS